ncbi:MAG: hypothetical protein ACR2MG_10555 [Pyrinomonadaceae bacterium]
MFARLPGILAKGFVLLPYPTDSDAFRFAGFGTHKIVVYYDLFRFLLGECFERKITKIEVLGQVASDCKTLIYAPNLPKILSFRETNLAELIEQRLSEIKI